MKKAFFIGVVVASVVGAVGAFAHMPLFVNNPSLSSGAPLIVSTEDCPGGAGVINFDSGTMAVDCTNNRVGIGTTAPATPLNVVGSTYTTVLLQAAQTANSNKGSGIHFGRYASATDGFQGMMSYSANGYNTLYIGGGYSGFAGASTITFHACANPNTSCTTEIMRVQNNGNVGIGTTSPTSALHVVGAITPTAKTKANFDALDPVAANEVYVCSDCTNAPLFCISTGTAVAQWKVMGTASTGCGSNE